MMSTLFWLLTASASIVFLADRHPVTRRLIGGMVRPLMRGPVCRSFLLDIPLLLPLVGVLVEMATRHVRGGQCTRRVLYAVALAIFFLVAGGLYFDCLNLSFLAPTLGHPAAWGGNHFMWNSGIELLGLKPIVAHEAPTYREFLGFWNVLAMALFIIVYPLVLVRVGTWLHGILFGYTEKQTGITALFFERHMR